MVNPFIRISCHPPGGPLPSKAHVPEGKRALFLELTRSVADPEVCNSCLLKSKCTGGKSGRAVNCNFGEEYFEKVKAYYDGGV